MLRQIVRFIQYGLPEWDGLSLDGYSFNFNLSNTSADKDVNGYKTFSFQVLHVADAQTLLDQMHDRFVTSYKPTGMEAGAAREERRWNLPKLNWNLPVYLNIYIKPIV